MRKVSLNVLKRRRRGLALLVQIAGVLLMVGGVAAFSVPVAAVILGVLLVVAGEIQG